MDQRERVGDLEEGIRLALEGHQSEMWTALPGIVESVDFTKMTVTVQPTIRGRVHAADGTWKWVTMPVLLDVPIVFPAAGGFILTFPIVPGDEVLVIFASRCIDAWWQQSGVQIQSELRMHDLSDGFALPGPRSVPNAFPGISTSTVQLRSQDGATFVELAAGQIVNIAAPGGCKITGPVTIDGDLVVNGSFSPSEQIAGDLFVNGSVTATGEGTFRGIQVSVHLHDGVTPGPSNSGPPIP